jgi:hypothetical protein
MRNSAVLRRHAAALSAGLSVGDETVSVAVRFHSYIVVHQCDLVPWQHEQLSQSQLKCSVDLPQIAHRVNFFHASSYDKFGLNFYVCHLSHVELLPSY